jgi:hypothetical protein
MRTNLLNQRQPNRKPAAPSGTATRWMSYVIGLAMFFFGLTSSKSADSLKEYELKAAFLYNFTKFIEWPTNRFPDANAPFVVAVAGNSSCTAELEKIAKERKVNGRTLIIRTVTTPDVLREAHLLFIPSSEDKSAKEWLYAAHRCGALSTGESDAFSRQGGVINFVLEGEKIRFDLNIVQAEAAGLKVSAQLQKLARTVRKKS